MKHARRKKGVAREISPPKIESKLDYGRTHFQQRNEGKIVNLLLSLKSL